ncbi:MAG: hypothetical protein AAF226_09580, partial [Verrucomicrobiota bacterium]
MDGDEATIELDPLKVDKHTFDSIGPDGTAQVAQGPDASLAPGSFVGFEIDIDISDFHAFDEFFVEDYLGDGWEFVSNAEVAANEMFDEDTGAGTGVTIPSGVTGPEIAAYFSGLNGCNNGEHVLGSFDPVTGEPLTFAPFVDPHETINLDADPIPLNPLTGEPVADASGGAVWNSTDQVGGDLLTWNFSHVFDGTDATGSSAYAIGEKFGLFVNGDANGDGKINADEAAFLGQASLEDTKVGSLNMTDTDGDGIPDAMHMHMLDVDGDGIVDGIDFG